MVTQEQKPETKRATPLPAASKPASKSKPSSKGLSQAQAVVDAFSRFAETFMQGMEEKLIIERRPLETRNIAAQSAKEIEAWTLSVQDKALLDSFDSRLTEAHRGMDRILARLNVE